ncbi:Exosome complex component RRP45B-like protein [Drosera capensis]
MEQRLASAWRMTVNEKQLIETAVLSEFRLDGRGLYDSRNLNIKFGKPYRDRPNEGTLSIFTEFSPMADPSSEPGRPGESAIELGRIIDRGLRESKAVDTESLCVLAGKLVWSIRIDLHIIDNTGNLVDAANIAALAALLTFRRPECSLGGEDGQELIIHLPEAREPLPLIIHHLPIAVTFVSFDEGNITIVDPNYHEERVMKGRMTVTVNANGDVCAIQKAGGVGIIHSSVMQCLRLASVKALDMKSKIKTAVKAYDEERALGKIKCHPSSSAVEVSIENSGTRGGDSQADDTEAELRNHIDKSTSGESHEQSTDMEVEAPSVAGSIDGRNGKCESSIAGPSNWDPYSRGAFPDNLKASLASFGSAQTKGNPEPTVRKHRPETNGEQINEQTKLSSATADIPIVESYKEDGRTLKDAVKPKNKRKKKASSTTNPN